MTIKRIHINQHVIKANKKNGTNDPPITVKIGKLNQKCRGVIINGPSELVYRPDKPLPCGATVWLFSESPIACID